MYEALTTLFNNHAENEDFEDEDAPNYPWQGFAIGHGYPLAEDFPNGEMAMGYAAFLAPPPVPPAPVPDPIVLEALAERMTVGRPLRLIRRASFSGLT